MDEKSENTGVLLGYQEKPGGQFIEGNPGKPKGAISYSKKLDIALSEIETSKGKDLFRRFIERAFIDDKVLVAAMKKFVPDIQQTNLETTEPIQLVIEHVNKKD